MTDENYEARAQAHLASIKRDMRASLEDAVVRAAHKVMAEFEAKSDKRLMEDWGPGPYEARTLYTSQPQRKPLTDEEISEIAINNPPMVHEFARAIEAAHNIKE